MSVDPSNILLFDGECNLCHASVRFVIRHDKNKIIHFASLQSETGKRILNDSALALEKVNTVVYHRKGENYTRSAAVFEVLYDLGGVWRILAWFRILPSFILDYFYDLVARNRYRFFGKRTYCEVSKESSEDLFLK